jgi:hypothetical protein
VLGTTPEDRRLLAIIQGVPVPPNNHGTAGITSRNPVNQLASVLESGGIALQTTIDSVAIHETPHLDPDAAVADDVLDTGVTQDERPPPTKGQKNRMAKQARLVSRDAGDILHTISFEDVMPVPDEVTWDQDPELLCCYNWSDNERSNTIYVPGGPPRWTPQSLPHTLKPDSGFNYKDYNYVRKPRDPYSPMFEALNVMKPDMCFNDVDVIADRNNLRVLLEFVSGVRNGPFRLDLFVTLDTLMLVRNGDKMWMQSGKGGAGYGGNFEMAFTRPGEGLEDATSHYRAIRYPMGSLNVVCRFEADAYCDEAPDELTAEEVAVVSGGIARVPAFNYAAPISILQKGHVIPSAQMAELKTTAYKPEDYGTVKCMDQLWFGRTKHLITGRYQPKTGVMEAGKVKVEDATPKITNWQENKQENLRKLVALLKQLRDLVKQERGPIRAAVLVREERDGPIVVRSKEMRYPIVKREYFERHWQLRRQPHFDGGRGQGYGPGSLNRGGMENYRRAAVPNVRQGGIPGYEQTGTPQRGTLDDQRGQPYHGGRTYQGYQQGQGPGYPWGGAQGYGPPMPQYGREISRNQQSGGAPTHGRDDSRSSRGRGRGRGGYITPRQRGMGH